MNLGGAIADELVILRARRAFGAADQAGERCPQVTQSVRLSPGADGSPSLEPLPSAGEGYDKDRVREAFDAFRRHASQLQAQLRVLQAARKSADVEPTGHAVRMDALHLIRAAAEFADTLERDAQTASAAQLTRTEQEVRGRQTTLQAREAEVERFRTESERQRAENGNAAKTEARDLLAKANADATRELREAEARASRLFEQSRHQATEFTNAARAEVEQTLEWARAQASGHGARPGRRREARGGRSRRAGDDGGREAILGSLEETTDAPSRPAEATRCGPPPAAPPVSVPAPAPPVSSAGPERPAAGVQPASGAGRRGAGAGRGRAGRARAAIVRIHAMPRGLGLRFARGRFSRRSRRGRGALELGWPAIVAVMSIAWIATTAIEWRFSRVAVPAQPPFRCRSGTAAEGIVVVRQACRDEEPTLETSGSRTTKLPPVRAAEPEIPARARAAAPGGAGRPNRPEAAAEEAPEPAAAGAGN